MDNHLNKLFEFSNWWIPRIRFDFDHHKGTHICMIGKKTNNNFYGLPCNFEKDGSKMLHCHVHQLLIKNLHRLILAEFHIWYVQPNYRYFLCDSQILSNNLGSLSRSHPSISFVPDKLRWNHKYLTMQFSLLKMRKSSSKRMSKNCSGSRWKSWHMEKSHGGRYLRQLP